MAFVAQTYSFEEVLASSKMTQIDTNIDEVRSFHKGSSQPAELVAGVHWIDDSATPWQMKVYDGSAFIPLWYIDPTNDFGGILLAAATPSSAASVDFTDLSSAYQAYLLVFDSFLPATDAVNLILRTSTDNGSSFDASGGDYAWAVTQSLNGTVGGSGNAGDSEITLNKETIGNVAGEEISGRVVVYDPSASNYTKVTWEAIHRRASDQQPCALAGGAEREEAAAVDAVQLLFSSGNIASGEIRLYGLRDA